MSADEKAGGQVLLALAYLSAVLCAGGFFYGLYLILAQSDGSALVLPFVTSGVAAVAGIGFTFAAVLKRTDVAGEHILFDTWFPMFMALVPVAGPFITLWSAIRLLAGRLGAATITSSSHGTRVHDAKRLYGSGLPGGVILLVLASAQPLLATFLSIPEEAAAFFGVEPVENVWDGRSELRCEGSQRYKLQGASSEADWVQLTGHCQLQILQSQLTLAKGIDVKDDARLTVEGGRLESRSAGIHARERAHVQLEDVTLVAPNSIQASDESTVFVRGGMIHGKSALSASGHAVITLRKVERLGKVDKRGEAVIHELAEGELEEAVVRRARGMKAVVESTKEHVERYQQEACKGFVECYQRHQVRGEISGRIEMQVGVEGKVVKVLRRKIGPTTDEVRKCIEALSESKVIPDFAGPTGTLYCSYEGTVTPESRMLDLRSIFNPDKDAVIQVEKPK
ncbi:MAG: hypothetical protein JXR96_14260 [Deltaproteobacteria bacterium]|nr:hypothetical protein [Deltaproteobacteria bacterium]